MAQSMNSHSIDWQAVGEETVARVHSHDERVSVRSLQWGMRVLYEVVARFASSL